MPEAVCASWARAESLLATWHRDGDRDSARAALKFVEIELAETTPPMVRRSWGPDALRDALQDFLLRLLESPLPEGISDLGRYLQRAFRNHCIDLHRAKVRSKERLRTEGERSWDPPDESSPSPLDDALASERNLRIRSAIANLSLPDRVVLKLELAPEWLTDEERDWLAERSGMTSSELSVAILAADDSHALTKIFDPDDDESDEPEARRLRMERFRRRRARARDKLRALLGEDAS